jgi:HAMP domain-containing protein
MALIAILSLIASIGLAFGSYKFNERNALKEAKLKGEIVYNYMSSSRDYFRQHQLPVIYAAVGREEFIPEIMSPFAVVRGVFEKFRENTTDYIFKQATKNPLVPANKADAEELQLIAEFHRDKSITEKEGRMVKSGNEYYYFAQPIRVTDETCLECHGDPADAPEEQLDIYGEENGYHWENGDTVSALIIYVPIQKALNEAKRLSLMLFLIGTGGIVVLMLLIWIFFSMYVVKPIIVLEQRATEISLGKNLDKSINIQSQDEIGSLGRAIDRLRISVEKMLQRYK